MYRVFINEWNKVATPRDNNKSRALIFLLINMKHMLYHFLIPDSFNHSVIQMRVNGSGFEEPNPALQGKLAAQ